MLSEISAFFDELEPVDILRAGALVLFFIGSVFVNRKRQTWFQGETMAMAVGGLLWVLVPEVLLEIQTSGKPDVVHSYLGHILGVALLSAACSHGRNDKGENVNLARIIAGFVCSAGLVVGGTYGYFKYAKDANHFTLQFLTMGGLMMSLWCIGSMIMAYRECSDGVGYNNFEDSDRQLIIYQLIDLGFLGLGLTHCMGCPSFLKDAVILESVKIDGIHQTLLRGLGALFMYKFLVVLSTLIFQSEDPSVNAEQSRDNFLSRIVYLVSGCIFVLWYQYTYHLFRTDHVIASFVMCVLWGLNSWLGVKAGEKEING